MTFNNYRKHLWFLKDSVIKDIDTLNMEARGKNDNIYFFNYKKYNYDFIVWKLNNLGNLNLEEITFNQDFQLGNIPFKTYEVIDKNDSLPLITYLLGAGFNNSLKILIDRMPHPVKLLTSNNYKGFFGEVNKIILSDKVNGKDKYIIKLEYFPKPIMNLFLVFKKNDFYYIVIINSTEYFSESIINIFNFDIL